MNKMELTILLLIPLFVVGISYYGTHQINTVDSSHKSDINITNKIEDFTKKIQSESPEQTKNNLIKHIKYTNRLLIMELKSEQEYIDVMQSSFRNALTFSIAWVFVVVAIFFTSNKRRAN